jgi:anhydro-N-acetylmuramic acid kinase
VIADFRPADMAVGGHGAPLVPYVDYLLFASPEESRAVQNIGGIGNVTFLPQGATEEAVLAFDTGTGNMLIDALVQELTEGRVRYDEAGAWAAQGESDFALLSEVLEMPFFAQPPPRTTGREMFGRDFTEEFLRKACARSLSEADILATATEITVESIAQAYERFLPPLERVILGGGGVHNTYLMERLKQRLPRPIFQTHQDFGLPNDAKEAVAFALMGYETLHLRPANLPSATGAKRRAILGKVAYPPV